MTPKDSQPKVSDNDLAPFRQQIDALDDKIIALLLERIGIVARVGEMKRKAYPGQCPIRPGREAEMVRRVMRKFEHSAFRPEAAAALWRTLIGASTGVEGRLSLSVYAPDRDNHLCWLAREYFGPCAPVARHPHVKRVIGDVMDGKVSVGIVPAFHEADGSYWWTNLVQPGADMPRIFACLPFVRQEASAIEAPAALAIARIQPEETGSDISLIVIEADHNVSQNRLQTLFSQAKLEARWLGVATLSSLTRHHLIEIRGFVTPSHAAVKSFSDTLGAALVNVSVLGSYAAPITLPSAAHAAKSANA